MLEREKDIGYISVRTIQVFWRWRYDKNLQVIDAAPASSSPSWYTEMLSVWRGSCGFQSSSRYPRDSVICDFSAWVHIVATGNKHACWLRRIDYIYLNRSDGDGSETCKLFSWSNSDKSMKKHLFFIVVKHQAFYSWRDMDLISNKYGTMVAT